ncbi:DUF2891 domain-containing protein [Chlorogloeopsis sp. ULAP01]|uniref:DUF2891 domain-containing protein n=1 Tax=Chlorogloeopsis sp. ULAP01 TaxID=3056483 RepID=UPI0025AAF656|nr:DUF2891 domain-containing protein [Chlorogloeopsis sp. ULAP01]MDM9380221.1 DUF2891 domain-containing protein [Chlorogloeopsis sp. ULAP01]
MQLEAMEIDAAIATKFVQLVLNCIRQEYPHNNIFWFESDEDIKPPRELTPAFYGCLDWHSAVHGHWLLARLARYFPDAEFQKTAREALTQTLTSEKIQGEVAHLHRCPFFECPYGFSWLLQLATELYEWDDSQAKEWLAVLEPLEMLIANNFHRWLQRLELPDRTGGHFQTAFPLSLALDWARSRGNKDFANLIENKAQKFYLHNRNYPFHFEPLGYDFVSPCLAEADLMRRILKPKDFANWLTDFLPELLTEESEHYLQPAQVANPNDYLQSHFRGLNLSRAWMLEGIISRLPANDSRLNTLHSIAFLHRQHGLVEVANKHYSSSHWLGTFAVYLVTARGLCR